MAIHDAGMFTVKGINRLKILQDAIDRNLHPGQAAEMLGITPRHCRRLLKRYRQLGPLGMNNHSRGRVGNRLLPTSLIDQALCIIREHYRDFGPTLALENLEEVHGLVFHHGFLPVHKSAVQEYHLPYFIASSGNTVVIPDCTICNLRHVRGQNNPSDCSARPPSKIISPSARLTSVVTSRLIRVGEL